MPVRLGGQLICATAGEVAIVAEHLPLHIALTRAEPSCVSFEVVQTGDPRIWQVEECFVDAAAFHAHQKRVAESEWGRVTSEIERRYVIEGVDDDTGRHQVTS